MSAVDRVALVPFDDRQILTVQNDDGVFVVMKPVVEALGLTWQGQLERIRRHPVISKGISVTLIPSSGGIQEATALRLEQFHAWLVTLSADRIADEDKRATIIAYQERAFRAVFEHFHGPIGQTRPALPASTRVSLQNQVLRIVRQLQTTSHRVERQVMHAMLRELCSQLALQTPPLDKLGHESPDSDDMVERFWEALARLGELGVAFDHSRTSERIAVSMLELQRHLQAANIDLRIDPALRRALQQSPRFIGNLTVNSRIAQGSKHCWVFRQ